MNREALAQLAPEAASLGLIVGEPASQLRAAALQQLTVGNQFGRVQRLEQRSLALQRDATARAFVDVQLQPLFLFKRKLAIQKQRQRIFRVLAFHTKSPRAARIFCVARKRQFLAASSEVPNISPMVRKRRPW